LFVPAVLDAAGCAELVASATRGGFASTGSDYPASYRNNDRLVHDDPSLATRLFARLQAVLPPKLVDGEGSEWMLIGLNDRFRYCRYEGGQGFRIHRDGAHAESPDCRSFLTLQIYLDDVPDGAGGNTRFYAGRTGPLTETVRPQRGAAIVFAHDLWHDGEPVSRGKKHVVRTDVMYRRASSTSSSAANGILRGHEGYIWKVLPLADGRLATASRDRTIRIWLRGAEGFACQRVLDGHGASVTALVEPVQGQLWSGSRDRGLREWDMKTGRSRLLARNDGAVLCLEPLGDDIGCGLTDGTIRFFAPDGTPRRRVAGHTGWVWALAPLTSGGFVSGSEDGTVRLWDEAGECLDASLPERGPVHALVQLDGERFAAGFADGHVIVYEAGARLAATQIIAAHEGEVYSLAKGPGGLLGSGGEDDRALVHRLSDGACLVERRHQDFVKSVAFLADGTFVSGSYDGTVRVG